MSTVLSPVNVKSVLFVDVPEIFGHVTRKRLFVVQFPFFWIVLSVLILHDISVPFNGTIFTVFHMTMKKICFMSGQTLCIDLSFREEKVEG